MSETEVVEVPTEVITVEVQDDDVVVVNEVTVTEVIEVGLTGLQGPRGEPAGALRREQPIGDIDGSNTTFLTSQQFVAGSTQLYLNGLLQSEGDYAEQGTDTLVFIQPPEPGDLVTVLYAQGD